MAEPSNLVVGGTLPNPTEVDAVCACVSAWCALVVVLRWELFKDNLANAEAEAEIAAAAAAPEVLFEFPFASGRFNIVIGCTLGDLSSFFFFLGFLDGVTGGSSRSSGSSLGR